MKINIKLFNIIQNYSLVSLGVGGPRRGWGVLGPVPPPAAAGAARSRRPRGAGGRGRGRALGAGLRGGGGLQRAEGGAGLS